ncbi:MAG: HD-GYP domain-containing protein [Vulcanimicrobiaceae bacterium]
MLDSPIEAVAKHHPETYRHGLAVSHLAHALARALGFDDQQAERISVGALWHDVGKIYISTQILDAPRSLTIDEWKIMREHPTTGAKLALEFIEPEIATWISQHHERLDGSGYPNKINGERIAPEALVIATADTWDALCSTRPYMPLLNTNEAYRLLLTESSRLGKDRVAAFGDLFVSRQHRNEARQLFIDLAPVALKPLASLGR